VTGLVGDKPSAHRRRFRCASARSIYSVSSRAIKCPAAPNTFTATNAGLSRFWIRVAASRTARTTSDSPTTLIGPRPALCVPAHP
jgi:hypothetical protein